MARRKKGRAVNGIILLNKAVGGSSNQVLQQVKRLYQAQKAGHTGALDPLASGMLPICLGEATKFSQFLLDADKTYEVTACLGIRTTTSDADGEVVVTRAVTATEQQVREACLQFLGESMQVPSMYSALKYQGKPLYTYARQGLTVPREARKIHIFSLQVNAITLPEVQLTVHCSKGTYIRSLVDDLGEMLGCGAYVTRLNRTQVAGYPSAHMHTLEDLQKAGQDTDFAKLDELLLPMDTAVQSLPACYLDETNSSKFQHGQWVDGSIQGGTNGHLYRLYQQVNDGCLFLGVGERVETGQIQPKRVVVHPC